MQSVALESVIRPNNYSSSKKSVMKSIQYIFAAIIFPLAISCNSNESTTAKTEATGANTEQTKDIDKSPFSVMMSKSMQEMMQMQMTNDPDHDFASMMKMHHQLAVEMAQHVLKNGQDGMIKGMAQMMITKQQGEIEGFDKFLSSHQPGAAKEDASKDLMNAMHNHMEPAEPLNNSVDHDFVAMMIPHHKSAVEMSESILKSGKEKAIKTMANKIIEDQKKEIDQLQNWLSSNK